MARDLLAKGALYWRTIRSLKLIQIWYRIWRRVHSPRPKTPRPLPTVRCLRSTPDAFVERPRSFLGRDHFDLLNLDLRFESPDDWIEPSLSRLWAYNLHYFEGLLNAETPEEMKARIVLDWIRHNRPGVGPGWEPYPLSLRIVNWIKWALRRNALPSGFISSLATQASYLTRSLEYHLLGNHLFANAKALVFAGLYMEGPLASEWLAKGVKILRRELPEQFLSDGGHFELSPTYHAILTEDLLDLITLERAYGRDLSLDLHSRAESALLWLSLMTRPDGLSPLFNDAAYGVGPDLSALVEKADRLGLTVPGPVGFGSHRLPDSGYFRYEEEEYSLFADVGPVGPSYLPGHSHCDMLSFELWASGRPRIVDTGTSTYEIGPIRHQERGTGAHNTVQVDDFEQSEIWASFRMGRRARILDVASETRRLVGSALAFPPLGIEHRRSFQFFTRRISIIDEVINLPSGSVPTARFHLHPEEDPKISNGVVLLDGLSLTFLGARSVRLMTYEYAPEFNLRVPGTVVEVPFNKRLETHITL